MLINIIGTAVILAAVAGAVTYLVRHHRAAKKSGGCACVGCSKCGNNKCGASMPRQ